jgi:hypothetical protein
MNYDEELQKDDQARTSRMLLIIAQENTFWGEMYLKHYADKEISELIISILNTNKQEGELYARRARESKTSKNALTWFSAGTDGEGASSEVSA